MILAHIQTAVAVAATYKLACIDMLEVYRILAESSVQESICFLESFVYIHMRMVAMFEGGSAKISEC